jgi:AsmA family protein
MGINVLNALLLSGSDADTNVRCAVAHFGVQNGVLTSQQFVFDTDPVLVQGQGTVDLGQETVNLQLQGAPKHFQLFRLRAPISVTGSLQHPNLGVNTGQVLVQGAIGAGLAAASPLAAILAFIDPGLAKNADCAGLIATAKAQGAPRAPKGKI